MKETKDTDKLFQAIKALFVNSFVNGYAVERVAFGYEKPGDVAPIDLYVQDLRLNIRGGAYSRKDIPGVYIDKQERISIEQDYSEYVRDLFVSQTERILDKAPKDNNLERDGEELPLLPRFREYLFGLLPLFTEILNTEVEYDAFDIIPTDKEASVAEYPKWQRFVTAILIKPLRSGSQINRYVKDISNAPHYIGRLIEKRGKNFYLKSVDINSYEYAFALFSLMRFMNNENNKLFELKMFEWERRYRSE